MRPHRWCMGKYVMGCRIAGAVLGMVLFAVVAVVFGRSWAILVLGILGAFVGAFVARYLAGNYERSAPAVAAACLISLCTVAYFNERTTAIMESDEKGFGAGFMLVRTTQECLILAPLVMLVVAFLLRRATFASRITRRQVWAVLAVAVAGLLAIIARDAALWAYGNDLRGKYVTLDASAYIGAALHCSVLFLFLWLVLLGVGLAVDRLWSGRPIGSLHTG
jgi:hypothetical protein